MRLRTGSQKVFQRFLRAIARKRSANFPGNIVALISDESTKETRVVGAEAEISVGMIFLRMRKSRTEI